MSGSRATIGKYRLLSKSLFFNHFCFFVVGSLQAKQLFQQRMARMNAVRTSRPFQERFLDGYNRSQLKREVQNVKPLQSGSLPRKCATMALGVSLAIGAMAVPLNLYPSRRKTPVPPLATNLQEAEGIAVQIKGRVDHD